MAYGSLLHERRRELHARIVAALEALAGNHVAEQVERLAHHALRGEVWEKALQCCRQAGEKALARSAHREAVGYCEQALHALSSLPQTRHTREQAIDLRLALRTALFPSGDSGRLLAVLCEAEALAMALDDPHRLGQVSVLLALHCRMEGMHDQTIAVAQRALTLATSGGKVILQALAHLHLGLASEAQGAYRQAITHLGQTVASFAGAQQRERCCQIFLPAVTSRTWLAWCHAELGTFAAGRALGEEGLGIAQAVGHQASLVYGCAGVGLLALRQGDLPRALPRLERAVDICHARDLALFLPRMAATLGALYTLSGRVPDAVALLRQAMEQSTGRDTGKRSGGLRTPNSLK